MKKIFFLIILFIFQFNSSAQEFNAGILSGLSTTQVSGDNLAGYNKAGLIIGGFVNRDISQSLALQIEMMYIQKGSSNPKVENLIAEINLEYIEIPLTLVLKSSEKINFDFGIHISALIDGYYKDIYGILENQIEFNDYEFGAVVGIAYKLNEKMSLCTRLSNSIIPIANHASGQTYRLNKGKYNTGLNFIISYKL
ncbi:MAG: hypothetical protein CMP72_00885 [Flavobacteriales bacterium]|nr:hypothetical protein [Flavobacteriales bacterium]